MANPEDVRKLAALARIIVAEDELDSFTKEFDAVLAYVGRLDELSLAHDTLSAGAVRNVMREDGEPHASGHYTDAIVGQFPEKENTLLKVKQIISHE